MKNFWKVLMATALLLLAAGAITGCSLWDPPYENLNESGYTVQVRYDANGGSFAGSPNEVYIVDVFNPASYTVNAAGKAEIPLVTPDDPIRQENAFAISKTGYFLAGWYTERTLRTNEQGEPVDEYGNVITDTATQKQGYTYSGKWDFASDRLEVDPNGTETTEVTLYAAWVPYFNFEFYVEQEDGSFALLETKQQITVNVPEWDKTTGKMNLKDFPAREGMTFEAAYMDAAKTVSADTTISGNVDYTTGTVESDGTIRIYTTWMEGTWFRISTPKQFVDNARLSGHYILEADLDFTGLLWPKTLAEGEFTGSIVGGGHTISGVSVLQGDNSKINGGLFGTLSSKAVISDLKLENITYRIEAGSRMQSPNYGLLAGTVNAGFTAKDVTITGTIEIGKDCYRPNEYNIGLICGSGTVEGMDWSGVTATVVDPDNNTASIVVDPQTGEVTLTFAD